MSDFSDIPTVSPSTAFPDAGGDVDPLDDFEPEAVPRRRLIALGILLLLSFGIVETSMVPRSHPLYDAETSTMFRLIWNGIHANLGSSGGNRRIFIMLGIISSPFLGGVVGSAIVFRLANAPDIWHEPRGNGILSALLCVCPVLGLLTMTVVCVCNPPPGWWWCFFVPLYICWILGVLGLFFVRSGPGRGAVAGIAAAALVFGIEVFWISGQIHEFWHSGPLQYHILVYPIFLIGAIALGFSCAWVYRRQRLREREFHRLLDARRR